jgi:hypothetical protein
MGITFPILIVVRMKLELDNYIGSLSQKFVTPNPNLRLVLFKLKHWDKCIYPT